MGENIDTCNRIIYMLILLLRTLGEANPKINDMEVEKLYVQANHFALVRLSESREVFFVNN